MNCDCFTEGQKVFIIFGATSGVVCAFIIAAAWIRAAIESYSRSDDREK